MKNPISVKIRPIITLVIVVGIIGASLLTFKGYGSSLGYLMANAHPHWPNLALVQAQPLAIQIHILAALAAVFLTGFQLLGKKGALAHRIFGWIWLGLMSAVALSSIFIHTINPKGPGGFSLIHILTVITLITVPQILYFAKKHNVEGHKRAASGLVIGGLLIAGLFTFMPGRLMWNLFFG